MHVFLTKSSIKFTASKSYNPRYQVGLIFKGTYVFAHTIALSACVEGCVCAVMYDHVLHVYEYSIPETFKGGKMSML